MSIPDPFVYEERFCGPESSAVIKDISTHPLGLQVIIGCAEHSIRPSNSWDAERISDVYHVSMGVVLKRLMRCTWSGGPGAFAGSWCHLLEVLALEMQIQRLEEMALSEVPKVLKVSAGSDMLEKLWPITLDAVRAGRLGLLVLVDPVLDTLDEEDLADLEQSVAFSHASFREYFAARSAVAALNEGRDVPALPPLEDSLFDPYWERFVTFFLEIIEQTPPLCINLNFRAKEINTPRLQALIRMLGRGWHRPLFRLELGQHQVSKVGHLAEIMRQGALHRLDMPYNAIEAQGAAVLAEALHGCKTLVHLDIKNDDVGSEGVETLCSALKFNSVLKHLNINGNNIGVKGAQLVADALCENQTLETLEMGGNCLAESGAEMLVEGLKDNATLKSLGLESNCLGNKGSVSISEALQVNDKLERIRLRSNFIGESGAEYLFEALSANNALKQLELQSNNIGPDGAFHLATALQTNQTLNSVDLEHNHVGAEGARHLAEGLRNNQTLETLELWGNRLGPQGGAHLGAVLPQNTALRRLGLRGNALGDEGLKAIADGLAKNLKLVDLDISANRFTEIGTAVLATALSSNNFLQVLQAAENRVGPKGGEALAQALKSNSALLQLDLGDNALEDRGALHFANMLSDGGASQMRSLELRRNRISSRGIELLAKALMSAKWLDHMGLTGNFCGPEWEPYAQNLRLKYPGSGIGGGYPGSPTSAAGVVELGRSSMSKTKDVKEPPSRRAMVLPDTVPE
eukprot:gnl/MRDRNA2_/MRDRNA2_18094_c0_seq1.p1 gnl/MRDRNA2_/MRDRNA2_18094_c0~~gnl/MRDRNA2_/MRDRNA2_18094_c0_seq1.p1  ORF type:complete len:788 (+),score=161.27 gnl/MRDRNA2_/MRDRNA2_18094_c0_seq1:126-2366(+)